MNAEDIFQQAIDGKTPAEREAFVASACGTDGVLFAKVQGLLKAHDDASQFLEQSLFVSAPTVEQPLYERPGTQIGPYKLLQQIGEGGMGIVFMAEQTQPVQRKVALKIIKPGMDSRQVIARFEAERQALAMMDHINIARVIDGGTTPSEPGVSPGRPYFVMELINGVPITKYCDDNHLTPRERLELFVPVCQAIQHAHQKGIIHRDIKPSNVLVTLYDGKPVPKVIDFGVAKAVDQKLTERTLFTNFGTMVGTLEYMSPEQADSNALGIDTRSDIYSLGVLLYELLTGSTPLTRKQFKEAANFEILRMIKEDEPQKPSTRLSESGDALASISAQRKMEPAKLSKLVRGELDWIVMKTLEKDRNRRYETANGLAIEVQRYLADEPVQACPPSTGYRVRKFVLRNRGAVIAASLVLFALVAGIIGTTIGLFQAEQQRSLAVTKQEEADNERRKAEKAEAATLAEFRASTDDALEQLIGSKMELSEKERAYLKNTLERWKSFASRAGKDERSRAIRAEGHHQVALLWAKLSRRDEAVIEYETALDLRRELAAEFPSVFQYRWDMVKTQTNLGSLLTSLGKHNEAQTELESARDSFEKLIASNPSDPTLREHVANSHANLGALFLKLGKKNEALSEYERTRDIRKQLAIEYPAVRIYREELATSRDNLGIVLNSIGKTNEAQREYEAARELWIKLVAEFPSAPSIRHGLAQTHNSVGLQLYRLGMQEKARTTTGSLIVPTKWNEARTEFETARDLLKKLAAEFPAKPNYREHLAHIHTNLGTLLGSLEEPIEACKEFEAARDLNKRLVSEFPAVPQYRQNLAKTHNNLAGLLRSLKKMDEARSEFESAIDINKKLIDDFPTVPEYQVTLGGNYCNFGNLVQAEGKSAESLTWYGKAIKILTSAHERDPRDGLAKSFLQISYIRRASLFRALDKYAESVNDFNQAIGLTPESERFWPRLDRVQSLIKSGQVALAINELNELSKTTSSDANQCANFAWLYSLASGKDAAKKDEYAKQAVEFLWRAVKLGFKNVDLLFKDKGYDPLRDREDFKQLIAEMEKKSPPKAK